MSSIRRVIASRRNGARSGGPKTEAGRQRSARNAVRHGLLARCVVLEDESPEAFRHVVDQHMDCFDAHHGVGLVMVEEMAAAYWRMRRLWAIETRLYDDAVASHPSGDEIARITAAFKALAESPQFALLHRYETRLHRMYQRAFHNAFLLREMNLPNEPSPIPGHGHIDIHLPGLPEPATVPSPAPATEAFGPAAVTERSVPRLPGPQE